MSTEKNVKKTVEALEVKNSIPEAEKKPFNKFGKQETHEVKGVEYTLQYPGTRRTQQILDSATSAGGTWSDEAYYQRLMEDVIVQPKTDWDYWDQNEGYREVMKLADNFLGRMLK